MSKAALLAMILIPAVAHAQDVPGIEICTVEKTMERRTSCLQSNVDFLKTSMSRDALAQQKKLDAATAEIAALRGQVETLKAMVATLQGGLAQLRAQLPAPVKDASSIDPKPADSKPADSPAK
jgi:hypothetical protein